MHIILNGKKHAYHFKLKKYAYYSKLKKHAYTSKLENVHIILN